MDYTKVAVGGYEIEGFTDGNIIEIKSKSVRKWWCEKDDGFTIIFNNRTYAHVVPKDKQDFFDKHLKNLEDSVDSPFAYMEKL